MSIKAVIFDLDGTLIDSMGIWLKVDKEFLEKRQIEPPKNLYQEMSGGNSFPELARFFRERFDLPETEEEIMQEWNSMVEWHYENDIPLKPTSKYMLNRLRKEGLLLAVGTSNNLLLTRKVLEANQVLDLFDVIVTGGEVSRGKPYPDIYQKIATKLAVDPSECIVIEDVAVGVEAAKAAGMVAIAIEDEFARLESDHLRRIADAYVRDFIELDKKIDEFISPVIAEEAPLEPAVDQD